MTVSAPADLLPLQELRVRLVAENGKKPRPAHEFMRAVTVIGSGQGCDLILPVGRVNLAHAAIVKLGGGAYLCDLASPGGTWLNGRRVRWARFASGDEIRIGPFSFMVEVESAGQSPTEEQPLFRLRRQQRSASDGSPALLAESRHPVLIVGSDPACHMVLSGDGIALRHCLVVWTQEGPIVRDLSDLGTTLLNGRPIESGHLLDGDTIGVGMHKLQFETNVSFSKANGTDEEQDDPAIMELIGSGDPASIIAGRIDMNSPGPDRLWQGRDQHPGGRIKSRSKGWSSRAIRRFDVTPVTEPSTKESAMANPTNKKQAQESGKEQLPEDGPAMEPQESPAQSKEMQARVAAAQRALDERARKYRESLDEERRRLEERRSELQRQAEALRDASVRGGQIPDGLIYGPTKQPISEADISEGAGGGGVPVRGSAPSKLDQRVAELVELAQSEQSEIQQGEATIETLRLETERLRTSVARRQEKLQARKTALDERFKSLAGAVEVLRNQREPLVARLRKLDAEEASLQSRLEEGERIRVELVREAEALNQAQERLKARQQQLFGNLENERVRLQQRQAAMQRKAAELEQVLHSRLSDIEEELTARKADMESSVCDFSGLLNAGSDAEVPTIKAVEQQSLRMDVANQLAALGRIERQVAHGADRLDALQQRISGLGKADSAIPVSSGDRGSDVGGGGGSGTIRSAEGDVPQSPSTMENSAAVGRNQTVARASRP